MAFNKRDLESFQKFIHEKRGNENNFEQIREQLDKEIENISHESKPEAKVLLQELKEGREKLIDPYLSLKESSGSAWPEFENFITHLERAVNQAIKTYDGS